VSAWEHKSPSSQAEPLALFGFEQPPVAGLQIPATWHWSSGVQTIGFAPLQLPDWQVSVCEHRSPSSQACPLGFAGFEQPPVAGLQTPASWHWSSGVHITGLEPVQLPDWQVSACVHKLESLQPVPFGFCGLLQLPVPGLQVPALWHWSSGVHVTGSAPIQLPDWQVSVCVHKSPSSHDVPLGFCGLLQLPVAGLQLPALWHWSSAVQVTGFEPVQLPAWQVSVCVHKSPSSQLEPFGFCGFVQLPVAGLQLPTSWHWSSAEQLTGFEPVQFPAWQVSVCVQRSLSSQLDPSGLAGFEQLPDPGLQMPAVWHWSRGVHTTVFEPVQLPAWQMSVWVHKSPSSQLEPLGFCGFEQLPVAGLQVPTLWHWSSAVQTTGFEPVQLPAWQVSLWVHRSPSSQPVPFATASLWHTPPTQVSVVQALESSQSMLTMHCMHPESSMSANVSQSLSQPSEQVGSPFGPSLAPGLISGSLSWQSVPPGHDQSR
jgi:hypothetical protein